MCNDILCTNRLWSFVHSSLILPLWTMLTMTTPITSFLFLLGSSPGGGNQTSSLLPVDANDFPDGPVVRFVLYHPSLFKVEHDFPNVICIQDIPCNWFFPAALLPTDIGSSIHPVPDFIPGWCELILVPIIHKSLYKILMVLQVPTPDEKLELILGVMGQGATFCNQDIILLHDDFHWSQQYYCAAQFKKALATMNFSTIENATLNVYIHLENEVYMILDSILMNPNISPYMAQTNSALTKAVDQLIQQTVFSSVASSPSNTSSSALGILSSASCLPVNAHPSESLATMNVCNTVAPLLLLASNSTILASNSPGLTTIAVENTISNVQTQAAYLMPPVVPQPPQSPSCATSYTFQTCSGPQQLEADPVWDAFAGSWCFNSHHLSNCSSSFTFSAMCFSCFSYSIDSWRINVDILPCQS